MHVPMDDIDATGLNRELRKARVNDNSSLKYRTYQGEDPDYRKAFDAQKAKSALLPPTE